MGMPGRTTLHANAPPICRDGFTTTIGTALMAASNQSRQSADSVQPGQIIEVQRTSVILLAGA
jgi:hypothetical protein